MARLAIFVRMYMRGGHILMLTQISVDGLICICTVEVATKANGTYELGRAAKAGCAEAPVWFILSTAFAPDPLHSSGALCIAGYSNEHQLTFKNGLCLFAGQASSKVVSCRCRHATKGKDQVLIFLSCTNHLFWSDPVQAISSMASN